MKLLLVARAPFFDDATESIVAISRAALARGDELTLFLMSDGVTALADQRIAQLARSGAIISVCEHNRAQTNAPGALDSVRYESQFQLSLYMEQADRAILFE